MPTSKIRNGQDWQLVRAVNEQGRKLAEAIEAQAHDGIRDLHTRSPECRSAL